VEENLGIAVSPGRQQCVDSREVMVLTGRRFVEEEPGVRAEAVWHRGGGGGLSEAAVA
jgi:hypothetical protein